MDIKVIGVTLASDYTCVAYTDDNHQVCLRLLDGVRLEGSTLESALASKDGFGCAHVTLAGLMSLCKEIRKVPYSNVPDFLLKQDRVQSRRFIAGGTLLVRGGVKYALAFFFIGHEWFVRPVALSMKNTSDYYFLVVKKEGSA